MTTNTWNPGHIKPKNAAGLIAEDFLVVKSGSESVSIEWFWHEIQEWQDWDENEIQVDAWSPIPHDGLDEAIRLNEEGK